MPPILKSDIQKPAVGSAKTPTAPFDRVRHMKISESNRGGKAFFQVYSVSGRLLGAAATQKQAEQLRDKYPLTVCLS